MCSIRELGFTKSLSLNALFFIMETSNEVKRVSRSFSRRQFDKNFSACVAAKSVKGITKLKDEQLQYWVDKNMSQKVFTCQKIKREVHGSYLRCELFRQVWRSLWLEYRSLAKLTEFSDLISAVGYIDICNASDNESKVYYVALTKICRVIINDQEDFERCKSLFVEVAQGQGFKNLECRHSPRCTCLPCTTIRPIDTTTDVDYAQCCDFCGVYGSLEIVCQAENRVRCFLIRICDSCRLPVCGNVPMCWLDRATLWDVMTDNDIQEEVPLEWAQMWSFFDKADNTMDAITHAANQAEDTFAQLSQAMSQNVQMANAAYHLIYSTVKGLSLSMEITDFLLDVVLTVWQVNKVGLSDSLPTLLMLFKNVFKKGCTISTEIMARYNFCGVMSPNREVAQMGAGSIGALCSFVALIGGWFVKGKDYSIESFMDCAAYISVWLNKVLVGGGKAFDELAKLFDEAFDRVLLYFGKPPITLLGKLKAESEEMKHWISTVALPVTFWEDIMVNSEKRKLVAEKTTKAADIYQQLLKLSNKDIAASFNVLYSFLQRQYQTQIMATNACQAKHRPVPISFMLQGLPGFGKSTYIQTFIDMLLKVIFNTEVDDETRHIHVFEFKNNLNGKDNYITGLTDQHKIVHWSDAFLTADKESIPSEDIATLMRLIDSAAYNTPQADIVSKGKVPFKVPIVLITTNIKDYPVALSCNVVDQGAIVRRIDYYLTIDNKECAIKEGPKRRQLDVEQYLNAEEECPLKFLRRYYTPKPGLPNSFDISEPEEYSSVDLVEDVARLHRQRMDYFTRLSKKPKFFDKEVERVLERLERDPNSPPDIGNVPPTYVPPHLQDDLILEERDVVSDEQEEGIIEDVEIEVGQMIPEPMVSVTKKVFYDCPMFGDFLNYCIQDKITPYQVLNYMQSLKTGTLDRNFRNFIMKYTGFTKSTITRTWVPKKFLWFIPYWRYHYKFIVIDKRGKAHSWIFKPISKAIIESVMTVSFPDSNVDYEVLEAWMSMYAIYSAYHMLDPYECFDKTGEVTHVDSWSEAWDAVLSRVEHNCPFYKKYKLYVYGAGLVFMNLAAIMGSYFITSWACKKFLPSQDEVIEDKVQQVLQRVRDQKQYELTVAHEVTETSLPEVIDANIAAVKKYVQDLTDPKLKASLEKKLLKLDKARAKLIFEFPPKEEVKNEVVESLKHDNVPPKKKQQRTKIHAILEQTESEAPVTILAIDKKNDATLAVAVPEKQELISLETAQSLPYDYSDKAEGKISDEEWQEILSQCKLDPDSNQLRAAIAWNKVLIYTSFDGVGLYKVCEGLFVTARTMITVAHCEGRLKRAKFIYIYRLQSDCQIKATPEECIFRVARYDDAKMYDLLGVTFPDVIAFPNIMKHIVKEKDAEKFLTTKAVLVSLHEYKAKNGTRSLLLRESGITTATAIDQHEYMAPAGASGDIDERGLIKVRKCFKYPLATEGSWCAAVLVALNKFLARKILAIHVSGGEQSGTAIAISQEIVKSLIPEEAQIYYDPFADRTVENGLAGYRCVKQDDATIIFNHTPFAGSNILLGRFAFGAGGPKKSKITKSALFGIFPQTKAPAVLNTVIEQNGEEYVPIVKAWEKLNADAEYMDSEKLHICARDAFRPMYQDGWRDHAKTISTLEAIHGIPDREYYNSMNLNASAGPILRNLTTNGAVGKRTWIDHDKKWVDPFLLRLVDVRMNKWQQHQRWMDVFSAEVKDELRVLEKVKIPRIYNSLDLVSLTCMKRLYQGFNAYIALHWESLGMTTGINVYRDFRRMCMLLQQRGVKVFDGDFKKFDGSLPARLLQVVMHYIDKWYADNGDQFCRERYTAGHAIRFATVMVKGFIVMLFKSNPSGVIVTTNLNGFCVKVGARYVYMLVAETEKPALLLPTMESYNKHVTEMVNGDDNCFNVSDVASEIFNQVQVKKGFASFGMEYTTADKSDSIEKYKTIDQISYLKRKRLDWCDAGALDKETIEQNIQWYKRDISSMDNFTMALEICLVEAYFHGEPYFEMVRERIVAKLVGTSFSDTYVHTYHDIQQRHLSVGFANYPVEI